MNAARLFSVGVIVICTTAAWFILGSALESRSAATHARLAAEVTGNLGAPMVQPHPAIFYISSTSAQTKRIVQPIRSRVEVNLKYEPRKKGLLWYRAYRAEFEAEYVLRNATPITQTFYVGFQFPAERFAKFKMEIGEKTTEKAPAQGRITESVILAPGEEAPLVVTYEAPGMDRWTYSFGETPRVRDFILEMNTDFKEVNYPAGTASPPDPEETADGWRAVWEYSDEIGARSIGMDMPAVVNPGPVAARITFFAPVSLLFFFAVLVILGMARGVNLHPMNYFFLAAGCFAFQLLFAYLVDLTAAKLAFAIAAAVSLTLVTGYLWKVAGKDFARVSAAAQFAYMVLFSYSFFIRGMTGITITVGAIMTLAILMVFTAKVDWETIFVRKPKQRADVTGPGGAAAVPPPLR